MRHKRPVSPTPIKNLGAALLLLCAGCMHGGKEKSDEPTEATAAFGTPVTVGNVGTAPLTQYVEANATSVYVLKNTAKSNLTGYVVSVNVKPAQYVAKGAVLFQLKTKEARSIDSTVTHLSKDFRFSGQSTITAAVSGYVSQVFHQQGDYVQEGEQLATIQDEAGFVFVMNLPFQYRRLAPPGSKVALFLPDDTRLTGTIGTSLPAIDPGSQTISLSIQVPGAHGLPENLIAKVKLVLAKHDHCVSVPKAAILTNDTQSEFWIMQLTDSTTAVKVPIEKGIEADGQVEILLPRIDPKAKILLTGNYGLGDTAKVVVQN